MAFEKSNPKDPEVLRKFAEAVHKVRERHTNTVIIMAEAVMEMKANAQRHGQINGTKQPRLGFPQLDNSKKVYLTRCAPEKPARCSVIFLSIF